MTHLQSWGRLPKATQQVQRLGNRDQPIAFAAPCLPHGNGRSYGDSCLNDGGSLLHTRGLDRFIAFDPATGVLEAEAGVLLSEIIPLVLPQGWFLPVTPGTKFVTLGGAIANDVHGKNHHLAGSFGRHVLGFTLLRSDGQQLRCTPSENSNLFAATIGGLGLTGVVLTVQVQLKRVSGPAITGESIKFANLAEFFAISAASDADWEYTVAWVDCLAKGAALGRGLFMRGNHAPALSAGLVKAPGLRLRVPFTPPISLINQASLHAFNALYYAKQRAHTLPCHWHYEPFFYPLDGIHEWNRVYGPRGFYQYQCVVPMAAAPEAIADMLGRIAASGQGSFLAVLKVFGDKPSPGLLSFPRPGATLALDFPNLGPATLKLLAELDVITLAADGAVYPAKDARMSPAMFARSFPQLETFRRWVDPAFSSSLWRRVQGAG